MHLRDLRHVCACAIASTGVFCKPESGRFRGVIRFKTLGWRLDKPVRMPETCLERNREFVPNYGERYRNGEKIASGFVESAINQVVSKRMVKKQQMGWSRRGAHLLLQIRTRVLDEEWENTFRRWYPDFRPQGQAKKAA